jgi:predicted RNase H-like nuclease (RuvC/YqgF family)
MFIYRFDREKNQLINEINVLERRLEDQICDFDKHKENIRHVMDSDNEKQSETFTERFDNLKRIYLEQNEQVKLLSADFENERTICNYQNSENMVLLKDTQVHTTTSCIYKNIYMYIYLYICIYIYMYMYTYIQIHIYAYSYPYIYTNIHIYNY